MTTISRRFLQARSYLIIALLGLLLALYIGLLFLFTLWDRSEWAQENYADLLRQISQQESFISKFANVVPGYLCVSEGTCRNLLKDTDSLPSIGQSRLTELSTGEKFWTLRSAPMPGAVPREKQEQRDLKLFVLGGRFARFDTVFWGSSEGIDQSLLMSADGTLTFFMPHVAGQERQQLDIAKMTRFSQMKLTAFRKVMQDYPKSANADGVFWTGALKDPFTGRTIFSGFIPLADSQGGILGYASSDISPDAVSRRSKITGDAFQRQSGSILLYSDWGQLMLVDGRAPTADEIALYRHLDNDEGYERYTRLLQFRLTDGVLEVSYAVPNIQWRVVYAVRVSSIFMDRIVPICGGALLFLLLVINVYFGTRRIARMEIRPAAMQAKRLADSEHFNRTVVETSPVGLAVVRKRDGSIILQNAQFVPMARWRLFDAADQAIVGNAWSILLAQDVQGHRDALHLEDSDSGHFYQIGIAQAMLEDEPVMICVLSDMTDRKRTEEALAQAKLLAESASAAKSLFLATISHEIRTPLYGMLASIELMANTQLNDEQRQLSHTMDGSARTLKDVLNDALDFTKGETDTADLDRQEFDLTKCVETVVQGFWSRASLKNLELYCLMDPTLSGLWWGDALKLTQVLNNLINNAVKFTVSGSVTLSGKLLAAGPDGARIELSVSDTGPGIAAEDRERIFQAFGQASSPMKGQQFSGTGLGLFICQKFVAAMDGTISLHSTPGKGSTFVVGLVLNRSSKMPLDAIDADALDGLTFVINAVPDYAAHLSALLESEHGVVTRLEDDPHSREGYSTRIDIGSLAGGDASVFLDPSLPYRPFLKGGHGFVNPLSGAATIDALLMAVGRKAFLGEEAVLPAVGSARKTDARILLVDDQAINRLLLEKQLAWFGCSSITAAEGAQEALRQFENGQHFDLILTDINMPGMNGYELALALRARGVTAPIVAVTAALLAGERERGQAAGMNGYMIKPFSMDDLEKLLERHIGLHAAMPVTSPMQDIDTPTDIPTEAAEAQAIAKAIAAAQMWQPDMLEAAVESITADLALLAIAIGRADLEYLGEIVHRIHGGMSALDMRPAAALCSAIEGAAEYDWHEEAFQLAPVLQTMLEQVRLDIDPGED
ncbi:ATP-binding protein [Glaciimonas sp. GG7]